MKNHNIMGLTCPGIQKFDNNKNCDIEPYSLGVYISDGSFSRGLNKATKSRYCYLHITSMDEKSLNEVIKHYPCIRISKKKNCKAKTYSWSMNSKFREDLEKYGYNFIKSGKKFIPKEALYSDLNYRKKLLAGLIDGDGYLSKGSYDFISKSKRLIDEMEFLIHSVGGRVNCKVRKKGKIKSTGFENWYWRISFHIHENLNIPIIVERRKRNKKSYYLSSNRVAIESVKNNKKYDVYGFTLSGETGYYITDNFMLTHNSGKSICAMSLIKLIVPERFSYKNFCFYDEQILQMAKVLPKDSFIVRDEGTDKGVFGVGSNRQSSSLQLLVEVSRKRGLSIIFIEPEEKRSEIVKWYLETVDMDFTNRVTRVAVKEPDSMEYIGALYIPIVPEDDNDWVQYNLVKDQFIEDVAQGKLSGAKMNPKDMAYDLYKKLDQDIYKNKKERKAFIISEYPHYTTGEIELILIFLDIIIKQNGEKI